MPVARRAGHRRTVIPPTSVREHLPAPIVRLPGAAAAAVGRLFARRQLEVLEEVHPRAASGTRLDLGVQEIALDDIRGTAVGGPRLRGADFKPIEDARGRGWMIRYERLRQAFARMAVLPPIEAIEVGGEYWVLDGHNRVAVAREMGLAFLDANVTGIRWPGGPALSSQVASLSAVMEASAQQRAAASDRSTGSTATSLARRAGWRPCLPGCAGT
jgi:hypothetical protein